jgi:hypothetical protein
MISCSKTINFGDSEKMRGRGLRRIQNSPSTLNASINETLDFSNGITQNDSAANELLDKYNRFCQESNLVFNVNTTRPTISFLREFSHLLD